MKTTGILLLVCAIIYSFYLEVESAAIYPSELESSFHKLRKRQIQARRFGDYIPGEDLIQGRVSTGVEMFFPVDDNEDGEDARDESDEQEETRRSEDDGVAARRAPPPERRVKCNKHHA